MLRRIAVLAVLACAVLVYFLVRGSTVPEPTASRDEERARRPAKTRPTAAPVAEIPTSTREPARAAPVSGPPPDPPDQPLRVLPDEEGGQTEESDRIWRDEKATLLDIDRANMLDVCACRDPECVRSLQTKYSERRQRALVGAPNPEEEDVVRESRTECLLAISRAAYRQKLDSNATASAR